MKCARVAFPCSVARLTVDSKQCQHYESIGASCYANGRYMSHWICCMHDWTNRRRIDASSSCLQRHSKQQRAGYSGGFPRLVEWKQIRRLQLFPRWLHESRELLHPWYSTKFNLLKLQWIKIMLKCRMCATLETSAELCLYSPTRL